MKLNKNQAGLTLGSLSALLHLLWVAVVALGFGQEVANLCHKIHFIGDFVVKPATLGLSVLGVIIAFAAGYLVGLVFVLIWNALDKK